MIEHITQYVGIGFVCALLAAWRTVPLLVTILLMDRFFCRRIPARMQCFLWMLVLARLVLPFSVSSPLSTTKLADKAAMQAADRLFAIEPETKPEFDVATFELANGDWVSMPDLPDNTSADERARAEVFAADLHAKRMSERNNVRPTAAPSESFNEELILYPLIWGWAIVLLIIVSLEFVKYWRFAYHLKRCPQITDPSILNAVAQVCKTMKISRCPMILQVDSLPAPSVFGMRRPVLCLTPRVELSLEELTWVLRHELAHVKRWDTLILSVAQTIKAFHWFNPIAWIVVAKLRTGIEQAADDLATEGMSAEDIVRYGHLLLRSATQVPSNRNFAIVGLLSIASKSSLKQRIAMLGVSAPRKHWSIRLMVALLFGILATAGLTDAPLENEASNDTRFNMQADAMQSSTAELLSKTEKSETEELVTLDVAAALEKARSLQPGIDAGLFVRTWFGANDKECTVENGKLHATLSQNQARMINEQIRGFELSGLWQITIECRMVDAPVSLARSFDWNSTALAIDGRILGESTLAQSDEKASTPSWANRLKSEFATRPALEAKLSEVDLAMFIHRYQSQGRASCLSAPKVTFLNGQSATISQTLQRPFVTGFANGPRDLDADRVESREGKGSFQPHIETIPEGVSIQLRPLVVANKQVELDCLITESEIRSADSVSVLPIANSNDLNSPMVIQSPIVQCTNLCSHIKLDDNQSVCFFFPRTQTNMERNPQGRFYILTARLIDDSKLLEQFVPK